MQESTRLRLEGNWQDWKGRLKAKWGDLTDDELAQVEGNTDRLIGLIKKRSGERLEDIHDALDDMVRKVRQREGEGNI